MEARSSYFRNAEGIRGLACLIVLVIHSFALFYPALGIYFAGAAKIGVWLFFALSAFLLTNHLLIGDLTGSKFADYATGRILRIVPLYLIAVIIYRHFGAAGMAPDIGILQAATAGYAHLWTIPVEMKFYVLLAVLIYPVFVVTQRLNYHWALALIAIIEIISFVVFPPWRTPPKLGRTSMVRAMLLKWHGLRSHLSSASLSAAMGYFHNQYFDTCRTDLYYQLLSDDV